MNLNVFFFNIIKLAKNVFIGSYLHCTFLFANVLLKAKKCIKFFSISKDWLLALEC